MIPSGGWGMAKLRVGLLFGGGDDATLVNRIEHVFAALDVGV